MLTYELKKSPGVPLYEALYRCIRQDILTGILAPGQKLPSKRALSAHLEVSKITVEAAYDQLLAEGYIRSAEKVGYFVEETERFPETAPHPVLPATAAPSFQIDLTGGAADKFPFSVWSRLQRQVMLDLGEKLLLPMPNRGIPQLRQAIADHLAAFRGLRVDPSNILVGAGTDFLYNLLIQLLGRDKVYAVEEPGYSKVRNIYDAGGVACVSAPLDGKGVRLDALHSAQVLHISPSHHFPTGLVTAPTRRAELLRWTADATDRYIIEDDYDSEFRFDSHPMAAMQSLDRSGRVIYMNTFSKSLSPAIRISYMVLPQPLMEQFQEKLGFYSCTVPSFEQYTLARFLSEGYFEKHINRMRKLYKARRNRIVQILQDCPLSGQITIEEQDAGLHFILRVNTTLSDEALVQRCREASIRIQALSSFYHGPIPSESHHCLVVNYSGLRDGDLDKLADMLTQL